jgi:hypothetical protein
MAERVGFEPTGGFPPAVFKTAAIDHSAISPMKYVWSTMGIYASLVVRG